LEIVPASVRAVHPMIVKKRAMPRAGIIERDLLPGGEDMNIKLEVKFERLMNYPNIISRIIFG
jgi:hypothetical protein